jgi:hypothetical protein
MGWHSRQGRRYWWAQTEAKPADSDAKKKRVLSLKSGTYIGMGSLA